MQEEQKCSSCFYVEQIEGKDLYQKRVKNVVSGKMYGKVEIIGYY